jgi:hypothetical protein
LLAAVVVVMITELVGALADLEQALDFLLLVAVHTLLQ